MSKEKLTNQLKNAYKQLEEEFKNKGRLNTIEDNNVDYDNCNIYDMRQKIFDLEAKLAESEEENETFRKALRGEIFINYEIPMENERLKQQLAETEKKFQKWASGYFASPTNQPVLTTSQHLTQAKIDFAIEQLEKVKKYADIDFRKNCYIDAVGLDKFIDNQIKELRE